MPRSETQKTAPFSELYHKLLVSGASVGNHESDMYVDDNLHVRRLLTEGGLVVKGSEQKGQSSTAFPQRSSDDGSPFIEVPFYFDTQNAEAKFHAYMQRAFVGDGNFRSGHFNIFAELKKKHPDFNPATLDELVDTVADTLHATPEDGNVVKGIASSSLAAMLVRGEEFSSRLVGDFCRTFVQRGREGDDSDYGRKAMKEVLDLYESVARSMTVEDILNASVPQKKADEPEVKKDAKDIEPGM